MKINRVTFLLAILTSFLIAGCEPAETEDKTPATDNSQVQAVQPAKAQSEWKLTAPLVIAGEKMRMAAFRDESFGIAGGAGDVGKAHLTQDGGQTWTEAETSGG